MVRDFRGYMQVYIKDNEEIFRKFSGFFPEHYFWTFL
jgi:hypothetical protein